MAYDVANNAVLEIVIRGTHFNQTVMSFFHYRLESGSSIQDGRSVASRALTDFMAGDVNAFEAYQAVLSVDWKFTVASAQWITPARFARVEYTFNVNKTGTVTGTSLPPATAIAITKRSDTVAGRKGHGTLHLPAVPSSFITDGMVNSNATAAGTTLVSNMTLTLLQPEPYDLVPVIFNRTNPSSSPRIDGGSVMSTARTEKRRVVGRGI